MKVTDQLRSLAERSKALGQMLHRWNYLWPFLVLAVAFAWFVFFRVNTTPSSDGINRYLLSTVSQGLATVLAVVFTISLVAGQLASRYSPRMMRLVFKPSTFLYILLFVASVVFSLAGLATADIGVPLIELSIALLGPLRVTWGAISLVLAGLCLTLLIPYFVALTRRLTPEALLRDLGSDAKRSLIKTQGREMPKEVTDIRDTLMSLYSLKYYDAFDAGLAELRDLASFAARLAPEQEDAGGQESHAVGDIIDVIGRIGTLTLDDPLAPVKVIRKLSECAIAAAPSSPKQVDESMERLVDMVDDLVHAGAKGVVTDIVVELGQVAGGTVKKEGALGKRMLRLLKEIGEQALLRKWDRVANKVTYALRSVGRIAVVEQSPLLQREAAKQLRTMYTRAVQLDAAEACGPAAYHLGGLGFQSAKSGQESGTKEALIGLAVTASTELRTLRRQGQARLSIEALGKVSQLAIDGGLPDATQEAVRRLGLFCSETFDCPEQWAPDLRASTCNILSVLGLKASQTGGQRFVSVVAELASLWQTLAQLGEEKGAPELRDQALQCLCDLGAYSIVFLGQGVALQIKGVLNSLESAIGEDLVRQAFHMSKADVGLSEFTRLYYAPDE
ncbi:MAG: DUF2254 domain-containing protein [Dehalococcoidia bacterium]|nr:DUF2254 domain-containing protein [Dehalococcoidia bacterium]